MALVERLTLPPERAALLRALALRYEDGSSFPTLGDARAFLLSHHRDAKDLKNRSQAFKRMLPLLAQMSEKGLEKVISRSHHSGPADLDPIARAIRGAGETMRGPTEPRLTPPLADDRGTIGENSPTSVDSGRDESRQGQVREKKLGTRATGSKDKESD